MSNQQPTNEVPPCPGGGSGLLRQGAAPDCGNPAHNHPPQQQPSPPPKTY